ncbi:2971_t:CDS:2 [Dentiscutata erythropus]|uniref:2971_t:CDS:1 n=1 Tax=Dentiscutata erythropus TaxID=1348616 RepID=A0A9N8WFT0_9GLOM|nr:2971_t:CDS:2 [Dentiscutata erythropus]
MRRGRNKIKSNESPGNQADDALETLAPTSVYSSSSRSQPDMSKFRPKTLYSLPSQSSLAYEKQLQQSPYKYTISSIPLKHLYENTDNVIRLANEDRLTLQNAMQYAMNSLELACKTKNAISRVEESIQNLVQIITGTNDNNDDMTTKRTKKRFLEDVADVMFELLEIDKNTSDLVIKSMCYDKLKNNYYEKMSQVENSQGG